MPPQPPKIAFGDLESLLVLVEERHFARAAERLGITQSALARTIRRLEAELDVPLVTRRSPAVTPTVAGERFAEQVHPLLGGLRLAAAEARRAAGVLSPVKLGCVPDLSLQHLQAFLGGLYPQRPEWEIDVAFLSTAEQLRRLRDGGLDLALIRDAVEAEGIDLEPVFSGERLVAILPVDHRLAGKAAIAPGDLSEEVLLVNPRQSDPAVADRVMTLLATAGHRLRDVRETAGEDGRSLIFAVGGQPCVAIMPASAVAAWGDVASLVVARPLEPVVRMPDAALAWRVAPAPELAAIVAAAREVAASLYGDRGDYG